MPSPPLVVLLVDDNPAMRALLRTLVSGRGRVVHECADGESALAEYRRVHPDVVLMDVRLGGLDGLSATRAIRQSDPGAHIVIVTEFADERSRAAAMDAGASDFLAKQDLLELPALLQRDPRVGGDELGGAV